DPDWIERIYYVAKDILGDTPTAQYWKREGAEEANAHALQVNSSALLRVVQARYPDLVPFASTTVKNVKEPAILAEILVKISLAQDKQAAIDVLNELVNSNGNG